MDNETVDALRQQEYNVTDDERQLIICRRCVRAFTTAADAQGHRTISASMGRSRCLSNRELFDLGYTQDNATKWYGPLLVNNG